MGTTELTLCPKCGKRLAFLKADADDCLYDCPEHGLVVLAPDGKLRVDVVVPPITGGFTGALRAVLNTKPEQTLKPVKKVAKKR